MAATQSYLLVYHSYPRLPGERWLDKSNDPELRVSPMTWGICRTNVRQWIRPGANLFFLAYPDDGHQRPMKDRYHLSARFHVAEHIGIDEAVSRFPGQPNVILDRLPPGSSLVEQLHTYLAAHDSQLAWAEREQVLHEIKTGSGGIFDQPCHYTAELNGERYVHAYWDHHDDWRRRLAAPYIVADTAESKILETAIPYAECARACDELPAPDVLQSPRIWRHAARRLTPEATSYLVTRIRAEPALQPTLSAHVDEAKGKGKRC